MQQCFDKDAMNLILTLTDLLGTATCQSTGITTSTVSAGCIVCTHSLIVTDGRRGQGVPRVMEVLTNMGTTLIT
jgi:hypothetical protein